MKKSKILPLFFSILVILGFFTQKDSIFIQKIINSNFDISSLNNYFEIDNSLHEVTRIVDGDTFIIDTGEKVRYIGINTPESVDPRREVECYGQEAKKYHEDLLLDKKVRLEKDITDKDKYGRLLRYVYLPQKDSKEIFINQKIIEDGYASLMTIPPNVSKVDSLKLAEKKARDFKIGLWSSCK